MDFIEAVRLTSNDCSYFSHCYPVNYFFRSQFLLSFGFCDDAYVVRMCKPFKASRMRRRNFMETLMRSFKCFNVCDFSKLQCLSINLLS